MLQHLLACAAPNTCETAAERAFDLQWLWPGPVFKQASKQSAATTTRRAEQTYRCEGASTVDALGDVLKVVASFLIVSNYLFTITNPAGMGKLGQGVRCATRLTPQRRLTLRCAVLVDALGKSSPVPTAAATS